jgi:S1-C subfamily serine protease
MPRNALYLLVLMLVALGLYFYPQLQAVWVRSQVEPRAIVPRGDLAEDELTTIAIFERVSPSVVYITTVEQRVDFWTRNVLEVPRGTGSGFIWDEYGHVVTNLHVIEGAQRAMVHLDDGRAFDAALVGYSATHDLAVLRISVPVKPPIPIPVGASADLRVGQKVLAIGNPFGLDYTLTTGVVSALDRSITGENGREIRELIQTDAAINPGNSGGPLIDSAGRLIGVNTAIYSPSGAYAGIGFAVPVDTVNQVVPDLIQHGRYRQPALGITANDELSQRAGRQMGVEGVLVLEVNPGSAAAQAGLKPSRMNRSGELIPGDFIIAVEDAAVSSRDDLLAELGRHRPGDRITLTIYRDGKSQQLALTLEVLGGE